MKKLLFGVLFACLLYPSVSFSSNPTPTNAAILTGNIVFGSGGVGGRFMVFNDWTNQGFYEANTVIKHNGTLWVALETPDNADEPGVAPGWIKITSQLEGVAYLKSAAVANDTLTITYQDTNNAEQTLDFAGGGYSEVLLRYQINVAADAADAQSTYWVGNIYQAHSGMTVSEASVYSNVPAGNTRTYRPLFVPLTRVSATSYTASAAPVATTIRRSGGSPATQVSITGTSQLVTLTMDAPGAAFHADAGDYFFVGIGVAANQREQTYIVGSTGTAEVDHVSHPEFTFNVMSYVARGSNNEGDLPQLNGTDFFRNATDSIRMEVRYAALSGSLQDGVVTSAQCSGENLEIERSQGLTTLTATGACQTGGGGTADGVADSVDLGFSNKTLTTTIGRSIGADLADTVGGIARDLDTFEFVDVLPDTLIEGQLYKLTETPAFGWDSGRAGQNAAADSGIGGAAYRANGNLIVAANSGSGTPDALYEWDASSETWGSAIALPTGEEQVGGLDVEANGTIWIAGVTTDMVYGYSNGTWGPGGAVPSGVTVPTGFAALDNGDFLLLSGNNDEIYRSTNRSTWLSATITGPTGETNAFGIDADSIDDIWLSGNTTDVVWRRQSGVWTEYVAYSSDFPLSGLDSIAIGPDGSIAGGTRNTDQVFTWSPDSGRRNGDVYRIESGSPVRVFHPSAGAGNDGVANAITQAVSEDDVLTTTIGRSVGGPISTTVALPALTENQEHLIDDIPNLLDRTRDINVIRGDNWVTATQVLFNADQTVAPSDPTSVVGFSYESTYTVSNNNVPTYMVVRAELAVDPRDIRLRFNPNAAGEDDRYELITNFGGYAALHSDSTYNYYGGVPRGFVFGEITFQQDSSSTVTHYRGEVDADKVQGQLATAQYGDASITAGKLADGVIPEPVDITVSTETPVSGDGSVDTPVTIADGAIESPKLSLEIQNELVAGGVPISNLTYGINQTATNADPASYHWIGNIYQAQRDETIRGFQSYLNGANLNRNRKWEGFAFKVTRHSDTDYRAVGAQTAWDIHRPGHGWGRDVTHNAQNLNSSLETRGTLHLDEDDYYFLGFLVNDPDGPGNPTVTTSLVEASGADEVDHIHHTDFPHNYIEYVAYARLNSHHDRFVNGQNFYHNDTNALRMLIYYDVVEPIIANSGIEIEDENNAIVSSATKLDFHGAGVTAVNSGSGEVTVTIPGTTSESVDLTAVTTNITPNADTSHHVGTNALTFASGHFNALTVDSLLTLGTRSLADSYVQSSIADRTITFTQADGTTNTIDVPSSAGDGVVDNADLAYDVANNRVDLTLERSVGADVNANFTLPRASELRLGVTRMATIAETRDASPADDLAINPVGLQNYVSNLEPPTGYDLTYGINRSATNVDTQAIAHIGNIYLAGTDATIHTYQVEASVAAGQTRTYHPRAFKVNQISSTDYQRGANSIVSPLTRSQPREAYTDRTTVGSDTDATVEALFEDGFEVSEGDYFFLGFWHGNPSQTYLIGASGADEDSNIGHEEFPHDIFTYAAKGTNTAQEPAADSNIYHNATNALRMEFDYAVVGVMTGREEGSVVFLGPADINCVGAGVTCSEDADGRFELNVPTGTGGEGLSEAQVDARISDYARVNPSGQIGDAQIPSAIARDSEIPSAFDLHDDISTENSTLDENDRLATSAEDESGDPMQYTTVRGLYEGMRDVLTQSATPASGDRLFISDESETGDPVVHTNMNDVRTFTTDAWARPGSTTIIPDAKIPAAITRDSELPEAIDDRVDGLIVAGTNITKTYDDAAGTLTLSAAGGGVGTDLQNIAGDVLPDADNARNVGTETRTFAGGRFTNLTIDGTLTATTNATVGGITVQGDLEAQNDIHLGDRDQIILGTGIDATFDYDDRTSEVEIRLNTGADAFSIYDGTGTTRRHIFRRDGGTVLGGTVTAAGDVIPDADGSGSVGSSVRTWAEGHFDALTVGGLDISSTDGARILTELYADSANVTAVSNSAFETVTLSRAPARNTELEVELRLYAPNGTEVVNIITFDHIEANAWLDMGVQAGTSVANTHQIKVHRRQTADNLDSIGNFGHASYFIGRRSDTSLSYISEHIANAVPYRFVVREISYRGVIGPQGPAGPAGTGDDAVTWAEDGNTDLVPTGKLATGTAGSTTYLRGDQTWAPVTGGSADGVADSLSLAESGGDLTVTIGRTVGADLTDTVTIPTSGGGADDGVVNSIDSQLRNNDTELRIILGRTVGGDIFDDVTLPEIPDPVEVQSWAEGGTRTPEAGTDEFLRQQVFGDSRVANHVMKAPVGQNEAVLFRGTASLTPATRQGWYFTSNPEENAQWYNTGRLLGLDKVEDWETLEGAIDDSQTNITFPLEQVGTLTDSLLTNETEFVSQALSLDLAAMRVQSGQVLHIGNELVRVVSRQPLNTEVERGYNGTTIMAHSSGTAIFTRFHNLILDVNQWLDIEDETVDITEVTLTGVTVVRGHNSTTAVAHADDTGVDLYVRKEPHELENYMVESGIGPEWRNFQYSVVGTNVPYFAANIELGDNDDELKQWEDIIMYVRLERRDGEGGMVEGLLPFAQDVIDNVGAGGAGNSYTIRETILRDYIGLPLYEENNLYNWATNLSGTGQPVNDFVDPTDPRRTFNETVHDWLYSSDGYNVNRMNSNHDDYESIVVNVDATYDQVAPFIIDAHVILINGAHPGFDPLQLGVIQGPPVPFDGYVTLYESTADITYTNGTWYEFDVSRALVEEDDYLRLELGVKSSSTTHPNYWQWCDFPVDRFRLAAFNTGTTPINSFSCRISQGNATLATATDFTLFIAKFDDNSWRIGGPSLSGMNRHIIRLH